ncbi:sugar-binding domain-containing protein [Rhizobium ruizarguesonis]
MQTSGAIGATSPDHDGARICQKLADKLSYQATFLHSPLIVDTQVIAEALRNSPTIDDTLRRARKADVVLASVGSPFSANASLVRIGYLKPSDVEAMRAAGAVGDIMGYAMDPDGKILDIELNHRLVGLHPKDLLQVSTVIVAAIGKDKVPAIRAARRGGYVNILVTDKITAEMLLDEA